jgi:hypothetical protein
MATLQPKFYKEGVLVPHLKMSIEVGTFASILHNKNEVNVKKIAQFIDYDVNDEGEKKLKFVIYPTREITFLQTTRIQDVAFAYREPHDHVRTGATNIIMVDASTTLFPCDSHLCPAEESFAKSVWNDLERVRNVMRRMLTSSSMQQGNFAKKRVQTYISTPSFRYIERHVDGVNGVTISPTRSQSQILFDIGPGLTASSMRKVCECSKISFGGETGISALTSLFGNLSVIGLRRRRPRLADPAQNLVANDIVHFIVEEEGVVSAQFEYAKEMNRMIVEVSYRPYIASFDSNGHPVNCNNTRVANAISRIDATATNNNHNNGGNNNNVNNGVIVLGSEFTYQDHQYEVVNTIDEHMVLAASLDGDIAVEIQLNRALVEQLCLEYLE